jgi:hypothetical protein
MIGFRLSRIRSTFNNNNNVDLLASYCRRWITTKQAQETLDLAPSYTTQELRRAYFAAAKKCHPDALQKTENKNMDIAKEFRLVTLAYEKLSSGSTTGDMTQLHNNQDGNLSINQQLHFRSACQTILGVPAEIVEECKRDAKFRQWLLGNTDAAIYWRNFLSVHGGLAPMLETTAGYLGSSIHGKDEQKSETRRKRVPRKG